MGSSDGRLYARGSCDMQGCIACALPLVPEFLAKPRAKPLHLAFSYDEEIACVGAPFMLAELQARSIRADGCVVGEPTSMKPVVLPARFMGTSKRATFLRGVPNTKNRASQKLFASASSSLASFQSSENCAALAIISLLVNIDSARKM